MITTNNTSQIIEHITAGKSVFTLLSTKTNQRYTYKIKKDQKCPDRFFCQVMFGCENDNDKDYRFIGWFYKDNFNLRHSDKCKVEYTDKIFTMLRYFLKLLIDQPILPETAQFYPSKYCARCGHLLTTPESIVRGIGPECARKV